MSSQIPIQTRKVRFDMVENGMRVSHEYGVPQQRRWLMDLLNF
jgi:hypothetical protein